MSETLPERPAETPPRVDSNSGPHVADDVETSQWPLIAHRLGQIVHRAPVTCSFDTSIRDALATLQHEGVGSMLVVGAEGGLAGIFTLRDLLARVALAGRSMDDPVSAVMTPDPITLPRKALALEAALAMTRHGIHHIVVADEADIAGVVSDKDLSALQQWGLSEIGSALRQADRLPALIDL